MFGHNKKIESLQNTVDQLQQRVEQMSVSQDELVQSLRKELAELFDQKNPSTVTKEKGEKMNSNSNDSAPTAEQKEQKEQKAQEHWIKAKRGNLEFLAGSGGIMPMSEVHEHSESHYMIGHQRFSQMLEEAIAEELMQCDDENNLILLDKGRQYLAT